MKTNPFEESLRKKLESVQPEFTERDWDSFEKFVRTQTTPKVWQQSKFWFNIAAASVFTALAGICAMLYQQNIILKNELGTLKDYITGQLPEVIQQSVNADLHSPTVITPSKPEMVTSALEQALSELKRNPTTPGVAAESPKEAVSATFMEKPGETPAHEVNSRIIENLGRSESSVMHDLPAKAAPVDEMGNSPQVSGEQSAHSQLPQKNDVAPEKSSGDAVLVNKTVPETQPVKAAEVRKTELLPVVGSPYRVGLVVSRTRTAGTYGILNEFILYRNYTVLVGLTKTEYRDLYFSNEKVFAEQTNHSFRKTFGNGIPPAAVVSNISTKSSLMQMPLSVGYRYFLGDGFSLSGSIGTNINLRFRQNLECDLWDGYKPQRISGVRYKKMNYPLVNNLNYSLGIEKRFEPIVLQAEAFYHHQNGDIPFQNATGPGLRMKLLYEIGQR